MRTISTNAASTQSIMENQSNTKININASKPATLREKKLKCSAHPITNSVHQRTKRKEKIHNTTNEQEKKQINSHHTSTITSVTAHEQKENKKATAQPMDKKKSRKTVIINYLHISHNQQTKRKQKTTTQPTEKKKSR